MKLQAIKETAHSHFRQSWLSFHGLDCAHNHFWTREPQRAPLDGIYLYFYFLFVWISNKIHVPYQSRHCVCGGGRGEEQQTGYAGLQVSEKPLLLGAVQFALF